MLPIDYSTQRGCATESHWERFVEKVGGKRVTDVIAAPAFANADFLFPDNEIVVELKILETEFGKQRMIKRACDDFTASGLLYGLKDIRTLMSYRRALGEIRKPLAGIAKKANRQIRETKKELGLTDWKGILVCINDNFRLVTPTIVEGTFARILNGSMSQHQRDDLPYQSLRRNP